MLQRAVSFALWLGVTTSALIARPPTQDPRAAAIVVQSLRAMGGNTGFADVTLQAMATYTAGSDIENGTATCIFRFRL